MLLMPTRTATVLTRPEPTRDRQGNKVVDWSTAVRTSYQAYTRLLASQETVQQSDQVITETECHLPSEAAITVYDRVEVDGTVYEVDGEPKVLRGYGPLAVLNKVVVVLKAVAG